MSINAVLFHPYLRLPRWTLAFLMTLGLWMPTEAIDNEDMCVADSKTLSDFVKCVGSVAEYARQSDLYPERIRELAKSTGVNDPDATGETPLGLSAGAGLSALVTELLKLGADPEQQNARGQTPLILALKGMTSVDESRLETLTVLLENGAQVNLSDKQGTTPLMLAAQAAPSLKVEAVSAILKRKPPIWATDQQGETVLFYLVRSYSPAMEGEDWILEAYQEAANLLLIHKPDLKLRNCAGQTVSELAHEQSFRLLIERLSPSS